MGARDRSTGRPGREGGPAVTRRAFLAGGGMTVASLLLPRVGVFGDKVAYAQDTGGSSAGSGEPTARIIVLSRSEIGLEVWDVDEQGTTVPVPGATVTISTLDEKDPKTLEATADEDGTVVFDVKDLGVEVDWGDYGLRYRFEGSVTVTNGPDYRVCTLSRIRVDGGSALKVPCCRIVDASVPYFESLSFNGWDMQYCDCEVLRCKEAKDEIPIAGRLRVDASGKARMSLYARDEDGNLASKPVMSCEAPISKGVADLSKSGRYLRLVPAYDELLPKDRSFEAHVEVAGVTYVFGTTLAAFDPAYEVETGSADVIPGVSYGQTGIEHPVFTLPDSWPPVLRGSQMNFWLPTLPIDFWLSPFGYFFFGIGVSAGKAAGSLKGFSRESFSNETAASAAQPLKDLTDLMEERFDTLAAMQRGTEPGSSKNFGHSFSSKFAASLSVQAYASAEYNYLQDPEAQRFVGQAALVGDVAMYVTLLEQFTIYMVPCFVMFNFMLDARISGHGTIESPPGDPKNISFAPAKTGIGVVFTIEAALSVGVGVAQVLCVSVRGSACISLYVGLIEATSVTGKRHVVAGGALEVDLVAQALVFSWTGKLWSAENPRLYDNWAESTDALEGSSPLRPTAYALGVAADGSGVYSSDAPVGSEGLSMEKFAETASIVTSATLLATKEATARAVAGGVTAPAPPASEDLGGGSFATPLDVAAPGAANADGGDDGYAYDYDGDGDQPACDGVAGVAGIAEDGGVVPSKDVRIVRGTFSNPRERVVVYDGVTYLFRIASVAYPAGGGTEGRTRLTAQVFDEGTGRWGRPQVLDVPVPLEGVDRADMFDYDFDVCVQSESSASSRLYQGIYVCMTSGLRSGGDATSFYDAACEPIVTMAVFNRDLRRLTSTMWRDDPGAARDAAHAVSCPRVTTLTRKGVPFLVAVAYLRHAGDAPDKVFGAASRTTCRVAVPLANNLVHTSGIEVDPTTSELTISCLDEGGDESAGAFSVLARSASGLSVDTVRLTVGQRLAEAAPEDELDALRAQPIGFDVTRNVTGAQGVSGMQPWPGRASYLSLADGVLQETSFDPNATGGALTTRPIGPDGVRMGTFRVSGNGDVLVFSENREGPSEQTFDADGNPTGIETTQRYRILASIFVEGMFSEPFPLAETAHALDGIVGVSGGESYTFVTTAITDMAKSSADMYYVEVPVVVTASVSSLLAEEIFARQGERVSFQVVVRNDGNVILTGCRATLHDAETGAAAAEARLSFASENVSASAWNPERYDEVDEVAVSAVRPYSDEVLAACGTNGSHLLADPASAGVLLPGKTGQYRVSFTIPANWHGSKDVYVSLDDFSYETVVSSAPPGAEVSPVEFASPHEDLPRTELVVRGEREAFDPGLGLSPVTVLSDDPDDPAGPGDPDTTGGGPDEDLPQTGDGSGLGVAGALAGAAVAAFAAYSARRTALERAAGPEGDGRRDGSSDAPR